MNKITMLGTGNGETLDLYNTCFVIQNEKGNLLVDTGGSNEIIRRKSKDISPIDKATLAKANPTFRLFVSLKYTIEFKFKENRDIKKVISNICCIDFNIF